MPSACPRRSRGASSGDPRERAGPGHRARDALREPRDAERDRVAGEREDEARDAEERKAGDDAALRPDPADEEPGREPADERAAAVGAEQQPGLELRQVVVVGEAGEERDDRAEQHRVDEHDRARR